MSFYILTSFLQRYICGWDDQLMSLFDTSASLLQRHICGVPQWDDQPVCLFDTSTSLLQRHICGVPQWDDQPVSSGQELLPGRACPVC